ncbi:hypothetical protein [Kangiella sediminilitoris]|uniref:Cytochrome c domain-containing protein n=1 Tax=Kangiella sediminilitoris TaxID=1144748 RepID=A0A1B3B975_9GAMM|nr:hypothetical protein [Kangiella sediminilitoris]AOE49330.1 hypothetical protein KS2013_606 [Kangiella sediminilitoris]
MKKHVLGLVSLALATSSSVMAEEHKDDENLVGKVPFLTLTAKKLKDANIATHPFINSSIPNPPASVYDGPLFQLRHDYPSEAVQKQSPPWKKVTNNGLINQQNAMAYVEALKSYVSEDMQKLIYDYEHWNASEEPWWQSIWLGTEREPIHGFYVGSGFPAGTLTDQNLDLTTYVLTLYDNTAAATLGNIWGTTLEDAYNPNITNPGAQYAEGSVIVKFAFVTPCGADWSPMEGTASLPIYAPLNSSNGSGNNPTKSKCPNNGSEGSATQPSLTDIYMMQFDIIVKDSQAAPDTGWVFSTLIYDKDAPGKTAWDKMVPLGATWGGNPDVINTASSAITPPAKVNPALTENWINMNTPDYARSTLGWDGRLSGPNDGAVVTPAWAGGHYYPAGVSSVGCLGCHSSAQYNPNSLETDEPNMVSFLLPTTTQPPSQLPPPHSSGPADVLVLFEPGSQGWMKWFQSRAGDEPMDANQVALDYDMVTAFKAIPVWQAAYKAMQKEGAVKPSLKRKAQ